MITRVNMTNVEYGYVDIDILDGMSVDDIEALARIAFESGNGVITESETTVSYGEKI